MNAPRERPLVVAAYGGGVDSTAMIIEMASRGEPIDLALFADTGSEQPETYAFVESFGRWMTIHGIRFEVVRYRPKDFRARPPYSSLLENCLVTGTLPSKAFGFGSCSAKWKVEPFQRFIESWEPAIEGWKAGRRVQRLIGFDCSPADQRRFETRGRVEDERYSYRYPLREWGWRRERCIERIREEGLVPPPKSACFFCPVTKPQELHDMGPEILRRIVLMEARAKPRLRNVEGLWRRAVAGRNGAQPRPGSMTAYIRAMKLLPTDEVDHIATNVAASLSDFVAASAELPVESRVAMDRWLAAAPWQPAHAP